MLIGVDGDGMVQLLNREAHETFQIDPATAVNHPFRDQALDWKWEEIEAAVAECFRSGGAVQIPELRFSRSDGNDGYMAIGVNPIVDEGGRYSGYLLIGAEVTERRELEEQLTQAQRLEAIGRLAAGIAHEINTPTQYVGDNMRFLADAFRDINELLTKYTEVFDRAAGPRGEEALAESQASRTTSTSPS